MPLAPLFGNVGARFDALKFSSLGSLDRADGMCTAWHTSPVKTWADMLAQQLVVGSTGAGSQFSILPAMLNKLFATRIKVINGYKDGGEIFQAMEKGEIEGRCSTQLTAIQSIRPQWLTEHKLSVPILIGRQRIPEFPDTPAIMEFAKDASTRAQLELMLLTQDMDRPVLLLPPCRPSASRRCARRCSPPWRTRPSWPPRKACICISSRSAARIWPRRSPPPTRCRPTWWRRRGKRWGRSRWQVRGAQRFTPAPRLLSGRAPWRGAPRAQISALSKNTISAPPVANFATSAAAAWPCGLANAAAMAGRSSKWSVAIR